MIVLTGQTPSHKNGKRVFKSRSGRTIVANNQLYLNWRERAVLEVLAQSKRHYDFAEIQMTFFIKDKRCRDLDNMIASVLDVLAAANVIPDDNCFRVRGLHAYFGGIDQIEPRAEIEIYELGEIDE